MLRAVPKIMNLPADLDDIPRLWLTTNEIVERFGVHKNTVWAWRRRGLLRHQYVGHVCLHDPRDVKREVERLGQPRGDAA